ncbi:hypothetical protein CBI38_06675 [Rhodococcus oxybenzonivorans]|uniref:Uncharacterized protein n=1 Tax=Rhodococcus oxybenzonivorans TaxID=1990687 RepID=A0A2S2BRP6_9NOCA|nr:MULTISPECIES: hypothetical protein [Rhodococcus]AWK71307.1 hypothetical protein CBI38_06675 [Rhodococcus oxybenzonivorans]QTJ65755.1 hypothetical protein HYG77_09190 [Rhodococcus sp. ZPP]
MWILVSRLLRRWKMLVLALPVVAAVLSRLGSHLERRAGKPTTASRGLLGISRFARRRAGTEDTAHRPARAHRPSDFRSNV